MNENNQSLIIRGLPNHFTLNEVTKDYKNVVIFVDFNNISKGIYYSETMASVVTYMISNQNRIPNVWISEWIGMQTYFENWAKNKNINLRCIYFSEAGQSYYHVNLYKDYKKNRGNSSIRLPDSLMSYFNNDIQSANELMKVFSKASWQWIDNIAKKTNIGTFRLENLDADFIPELLLRKTNLYNDDTIYLILSTDGDHIQTLDFADNIRIISGNMIIDETNWMYSKKYLKEKAHENKPLSPDKIILYKSLVGDTADGIPGIKGIGDTAFFNKFIYDVPSDIRSDDFISLKNYFEEIKKDNKVASKILQNWDTFTTMTKLVSFKLLIENLTHVTQRNESILEAIESNENALNENCNLLGIINNSNISN